MSNLGKWEKWNRFYTTPAPYGESVTYKLGADWLSPCELVTDWGCGRGWFRQFLRHDQSYIGIDGSHGPLTNMVVDLATFKGLTPGIFMRHVLEHNYDWDVVLDNAVASFTKRMCLVLFTPLSDKTHQMGWSEELKVPDISFNIDDITKRLKGCTFTVDQHQTATMYGGETVLYIAK